MKLAAGIRWSCDTRLGVVTLPFFPYSRMASDMPREAVAHIIKYSIFSGLGSVVALRPNSLSGLSSGTVADSVSAGRSLESLNGSSGF
jgi:hypothetical protein